MSGMSSRPVQQTVVYPQPTKPTDERDGVLWVDTSTESRQLSVFSEATDAWEPVKTDVPVMVTQEAVSYTESGVSLTHNSTEVRAGTVVLPSAASGNITTRNADDSSQSKTGRRGLRINPNMGIGGVVVNQSSMASGATRAYLQDADGNELDSAAISAGAATLKAPMYEGQRYYVSSDAEGASYTSAWDSSWNAPWTGTDLDITGGYSLGSASSPGNLQDIESLHYNGPGDVTVQWDSLPEDLSAWDIATWQAYPGGGSVTTNVETNDGSGWTTLQSDAVAPYDISGVAPDTDVRMVHNFTDPTGMSPRVSYDARRGER